LLLSIRTILGFSSTEMSESIFSDESLPIIFLIALNVNTVRTAIETRYHSFLEKQSIPERKEFVEQFLRKLFLFGPQLPNVSEEVVEKCIEESIKDNDNLKFIEACKKDIAKISCITNLSFRDILRALDSMEFYFVSDSELNKDPFLAVAIFVLEICRCVDENSLTQCLKDYDNSTDAHSEMMNIIEKTGNTSLKANLVGNTDFKYLSDQKICDYAINIVMRSAWIHLKEQIINISL